jgi:hypothetical protein
MDHWQKRSAIDGDQRGKTEISASRMERVCGEHLAGMFVPWTPPSLSVSPPWLMGRSGLWSVKIGWGSFLLVRINSCGLEDEGSLSDWMKKKDLQVDWARREDRDEWMNGKGDRSDRPMGSLAGGLSRVSERSPSNQ